MAFTNPIGQVQLAPGTTVDISGSVDVSGSNVGIVGGVVVDTIVAGEVDLTGSTQNGIAIEVNNLGAPPVDKETALSAGGACPAGATFFPGAATFLDTTEVGSVAFEAQANGVTTMKIIVTCYSTGSIISTTAFELGGSQGADLQVPALGNQMRIEVDIVGGTGAVGAVSGSTRIIAKPVFNCNGVIVVNNMTGTASNGGGDNECTVSGNIAAGVTAVIKPVFKAGPAQLAITAGAACSYSIITSSGVALAGGTLVAGAVLTLPVQLPRKPITISVKNTSGAGAGYTVSVVSSD